MKFISIISKVVIVTALVLGTTSCSDDDDNIITPPVTLNVVETAQANTNLSKLVAALLAADGDLDTVLSGTGPYTILAPTDTAFDTFLTDNGFNTDLSDVPTDLLQKILLNHVISGTVRSSDLQSGDGTGYTNTLSTSGPGDTNLSLYYNSNNGVKFNGVSTVTTADTEATNGIVHIVDAVIGLPDVTTFVTADPNFSRLLEGLTAYSFDYVTTLQGNGPFTIFAPNNDAFDALLATDNTWNTPGDIPEATLESTLNLHVASGSNTTESDLTDGEFNTLGGGVLIDATAKTVTDGSDPVIASTIVSTDVQAANGVIHVIDKVLLTSIPQ
ncbi:fasciclin domain-containing protein [Aquimarina sp. 2201CG5-10]|uniref:fasciclin domain-containing protein n=1 Tax=Aquimarina callyspongiae TaxID=3098150 RepID=UPI002AB3C228|nr:fasciclin domain-containing protein [Aquimarina sp. 2201CG5-10]MDY8133995.1 fasciclin domain-containing protein [Aquimarina sp. 2201CG5-10]